MKNVNKVMGLIALIAISGLICAACPDGTGGIATAFKFEDKAPPASFNIRSAGGPLLAMEGAGKDEASFKELNDYYDGLGAQVGGSITPMEFSLIMGGGDTMTSGQIADLFDMGAKIDFKNGVVVTPTQNAEPGATTTAVFFMFNFSNAGGWDVIGYKNYGGAVALAKFTVPQEYADALRAKAKEADEDASEIYNAPEYYNAKYIYDLEGTTITVQPDILLPLDLMNTMFLYAGDTYSYSRDAVGDYPAIPESPSGGPIMKRFVIPMRPITIPASAKSVTYNATLELNGIIEQYAGDDDTPNTDDDVFVLAKGFWERLAIGATSN